MQEHDDIDGLFKNGLEDFRPDASHLGYGPLASAIAAKTTVAGTAAAAKTGFFAKWGMTVYFGLSTVAAVTGAAIVYAPDRVAVKTNSKTIQIASAQVKKELQLLGELQVSDTVLMNEAGVSLPEEEAIYTIESPETQEHELILDSEKNTFETVAYKQKAIGIPKKHVKQQALSPNEVEAIAASEMFIQQDILTESIDPGTQLSQSDPVDKNASELVPMTEEPAKTAKSPSLSVPLDSAVVLAAINGLNLSTSTDSVENTMSRVIQRPPAVWPKSRFSIKAGLGYAPLKTDMVVNQENYIDSMFFFEFYQNVIDRPSIKNEFMTSASYQKRIKSNLQLGVGLSYLQCGWKSYTDYTEYYYVDNGAGGLYLVVDTVKAGERNITANSISLNLFTGYDFVLSNKWMIGTTIGLNLNQVFTQTDFRNYNTNEIATVNRTDFVIGAYGTVDLNYRLSSRIGLSVGASINGRGTVSRAIGANDFYNNASFGLNGGIHYFIFR